MRGPEGGPSMDDKAALLARNDVSADQIAHHQLEQALRGAVVDLFVANGPGIRG
jgi:hypothetical protein